MVVEVAVVVVAAEANDDSGGSGYGLGFYLYGINPTHGNVVGHTGGQQGCSAQFFLLPEKDAVVFVVSNTSNAMDIASPAAVALFDMIP